MWQSVYKGMPKKSLTRDSHSFVVCNVIYGQRLASFLLFLTAHIFPTTKFKCYLQAVVWWPRADWQVLFSCVVSMSLNWPTALELQPMCVATSRTTCLTVWSLSKKKRQSSLSSEAEKIVWCLVTLHIFRSLWPEVTEKWRKKWDCTVQVMTHFKKRSRMKFLLVVVLV